MYVTSNEMVFKEVYKVLEIKAKSRANVFKSLKIGDILQVTYIKVPLKYNSYQFYGRVFVDNLTTKESCIRYMDDTIKRLENYTLDLMYTDEIYDGLTRRNYSDGEEEIINGK